MGASGYSGNDFNMTDTFGNIAMRDARDDERDAIRDLTLEAYAEYATIMQPSAWAALHEVLLAALSSNEPVERIVAERDGALVGSVMLYSPGVDAYGGRTASAGHPEIRLLAVPPAERGGGIGGALLAECIRRAAASGASEIGLHSSESMRVAIGMYEKFGFMRAPDGDFQPPGAELVMAFRRRLIGENMVH
jgi:ribosomal protein S18 acetylase RimI-like enzyme